MTELDAQGSGASGLMQRAGESGVRAGDPDAFVEIYERYRPRVFAYLLTHVPTREEAHDLTQQVFLRAYQHLPAYRQTEAPFSAWLFRIARNAAIDASRRRRRHVPWECVPPEELAQREDDPEAAAVRADELRVMQAAIARLPARHQELLALRFAAELSTAEMAQMLGKREDAIRKQLWRIIRRLQEVLHDVEERR